MHFVHVTILEWEEVIAGLFEEVNTVQNIIKTYKKYILQ